ncbi:MAG: Gfo/Idh/MocA family oxidoreductase [Armatimonadetes bacterium]|nr:Gfo/Idh/MocA family oxidoreductase [Armatimonadota bacterium]
MRVGVVGAGAWGKNIVRTLHELGALAAVTDASEEIRNALAEPYPGVELFADFGDMLAADIGAVAVATNATSHHALAKQALERGKHVFVEKPMTLGSAEAEELCKLADDKRLALMVGHLLLYQPAVEFIKDAIDGGKIGTLLGLNHERLNLGRARDVENVLWSLGVHDIAVCLHLAGEAPSEVHFEGLDALQPGIEDDTRLTLKFPSGMKAHIHNSWLWPERRRVLTVVGSKGMLVYDELAQTVTHHKKSISVHDLQNQDEGSEVVFEGAGQPLTLELSHFIDCATTGKKPTTDGWSGLAVVRILEQASPIKETVC